MALTVVVHDDLHDQRRPGGLVARRATVTFDNSYPTGGEPLTAANLGLNALVGVDLLGVTLKTWDCYYLTTGYLVARVLGTGAEVANAVDLTTLVAEVLAFGY